VLTDLYDDIAKHGAAPSCGRRATRSSDEDERDARAPRRRDERAPLLRGRYFGYDDAIYGSLRLLEILSKDPRSLTEMLSDVP